METLISEQLTMVEDCEERESKLTEWETGFLDSIRHRLEEDKPLSDRQAETLDRIWQKVTVKG